MEAGGGDVSGDGGGVSVGEWVVIVVLVMRLIVAVMLIVMAYSAGDDDLTGAGVEADGGGLQ